MKKIRILLSKIKNRIIRRKDYLNQGERYDPNIADFYDNCHVRRYEFAIKNLTTDDHVIDIACGTGWGSNMLQSKCKSVIGVDISKDAIDFAKKKYSHENVEFVLSDFFAFARKADFVVSFETLEHIKANSFEEIINKLLSLTTKKIIGSVPYEEIPGNNPHHVSFHLSEKNFDLLKTYGEVLFFYQDSDGEIHKGKEKVKPQNLIFVFSKYK